MLKVVVEVKDHKVVKEVEAPKVDQVLEVILELKDFKVSIERVLKVLKDMVVEQVILDLKEVEEPKVL